MSPEFVTVFGFLIGSVIGLFVGIGITARPAAKLAAMPDSELLNEIIKRKTAYRVGMITDEQIRASVNKVVAELSRETINDASCS